MAGTPTVARGDLDVEVAFWKDEIETYDRMFDKFLRRGRKIYKKYKDVRTEREESMTKYNILWANVQTRLPALYARNPKVQVERRFKDKDPIGRIASEILERAIQFTLDHCNDTWMTNRQCVLDVELPGRACVWIRYVPHLKKLELPAATALQGDVSSPATGLNQPQGPPQSPEAQPAQGSEVDMAGEEIGTDVVDPIMEEHLHYEETKLDYVYWEDYGHSWARFEDEIRGKWRRVYLDKDELKLRFGASDENPNGLTDEEIDQIPLDWSPKNLNDVKVKMPKGGKKAIIYEIWDKLKGKVLWVCTNYPRKLDERKDPLGLDGFFPTPRPLYANLCNDDLVPTPNFSQYQDQANEIDDLSGRITSITKALKVAGVRDASAEGLDRLLSEGVENQLVPITGWAATKEKGGLAGTFELLPMDMIAETLGHLRDQRTAVIEDVYQLTGISDIVRGMSDPDETATAQQLKGQFSMLRIQDAQAEVQRFCRDQVVIIGQIVAGYDIETLKQISGVKLLTGDEKQQIQLQLAAQQRMAQMAQAAQAQAQQAGPPAGGSPPGAHPGAPGPVPGNLPPGVGTPAPPAGATGSPPPQSPPAPPQATPPAPGGMHPGAPSSPMTPAPGQAPISPDKMKLLELPTWEEVEALLQNPVMREFRLDIETDSTIRMDEDAEKSARMELISAVGDFVQKMAEAGAQAPEILPMLGELLMFGIRGFKTARAVEQTFDDMMEALQKAAQTPKGPPPKVQEIQAQAAADQATAKVKAQTDLQIAQGTQAAQAQQAAQENQGEIQVATHKAQLDASTAVTIANNKSEADKTIADLTQRFETEKVKWQTQAQERIAAADNATKLKIAEMANEQKRKDQEHEKSMTRMQHSHEQKIAEMKPKSPTVAA